MNFIKTDLAGKVRNLPGFKSEALLPLFEAIVNSIQAIEDKHVDLNGGRIEIVINRDNQSNLFDDSDSPSITGFTIRDNGIGFTDPNMESFRTSDSTYKEQRGGKGVGRFLWLKAFDLVKIESIFNEGDKSYRREIKFSRLKGIEEDVVEVPISMSSTSVDLIGFREEYKRLPTAYKTARKIAQRILEHCLSYFICGAAPQIVLIDEAVEISLNEIFVNDISGNVVTESIDVRGVDFVVSHIKLYGTHNKIHNIVLCADNRDVETQSLAKILGTSVQFDDDDKKFAYAIYVTSSYLDAHVDNYRTGFDIPDYVGLFSAEASMSEITKAIGEAARQHLAPYLEHANERKHQIVARYVAEENPALRAVPTYCPEIYEELEPNSPDERINEVLYKYKGRAEFHVRKRSEALLKTQGKSLEEVESAYRVVASQITDFQKDNLINYLCDRRRIIDLLERKLELNVEGRYANEDIIHDIIFPRKSTSDELQYESHNLWLIDEILAFHSFAASDKKFHQFLNTESEDRPDIVAFAELDEDKVARAVSIVEFKKPQRASFDEDPVRQVYRYLRQIDQGKRVLLPNGRDLNVSATTRYYCYVICDLTDAVKEFAVNGSYAQLKGELGYYFYNRSLNAHTELLAFDKLVVDAKRRHKAFFEKLGI